jgi:dihydroxy-acid dehydratase
VYSNPKSTALRCDGPIGLVRDGDLITIDGRAEACSLTIGLDEAELTARHAARVPIATKPFGGLLEKYAATVGSAHRGAVTHSGAVQWERDS